MKLKHLFLILTIGLANVGIANATEPLTVGQQAEKTLPILNEELPASISTSESAINEKQDITPNFVDTCFQDSGTLNLSFQFYDQTDSTDLNLIRCYIKSVVPLVKSVDSKKNDLIEIL